VFAKARGNVDNTSSAQVSTRQFETPNLALVNAEGEASFTPRHEFKLLGGYQIPRVEVLVSAFWRATSGLPYNRIQQFPNPLLNTSGLSSSYRRINLDTRGTYHLPNFTQLDLRFEKNFTVTGSNRFGVYADLENVTNRGGVTDVITRPQTVTLPDGTSFPLEFGTPGRLQNARQLRIGGRWSF
jgi:hypothetical protein